MNKMKNKIRITVIAAAAVLVAFLLLHRVQQMMMVSVESPNRFVMNTVAKIIAVAPSQKIAQASIDAAFEEIYRLEKLMNRFDPNSQISQINSQASEKPVRIDKDLFECLRQAVYYSSVTNGAFDITVGPLVDLWRKCAEANSLPSSRQLEDMKQIIGYEKVILDANDYSVRFAVDAVRLDLGGIAKGFAADKAIEIMKAKGAAAGLVDLGGQIGCFGKTAAGSNWIIGVRNPDKEAEKQIIVKLALTDMAVSTSGNYERFYKIAGRKFSHIFDPQTETSAELIASDTVICKTGTQADAISTAVNVLGTAKGLELAEKLPDTEAIIIPINNKNEMLKTSGAAKYIQRW